MSIRVFASYVCVLFQGGVAGVTFCLLLFLFVVVFFSLSFFFLGGGGRGGAGVSSWLL